MEENQNIEQSWVEDVNIKSKKVSNKKNIIILAICFIAIAIIIVFLVLYRSPKTVVAQFFNAYNNGDEKKVISLLDIEGYGAYANMNKQEQNSFSEKLKSIKEEMKKASKEEKQGIKDFMGSNITKPTDKMIFEIIKIEKDEKNKELTNIECRITFENSNSSRRMNIVTYKKGVTHYVVYASGMV